MKNITHRIVLILAGSMLFACSGNETASEPEEKPVASSESRISATVVSFTPEQQQVSGIELSTFEKRNMSTRVQANGQLQLPPQNKASINPIMGGVVRSITVKEGELVQKGKVLATIENPELIKLQEDYLTTLNQLKMAEQDLDRQRTLREENIGAGRKFEQAETDVQVQRARKQALAAHLSAMGISHKRVEAGQITSRMAITAPISGFVRVISVNIGTYAQPGQEMFEIVDNHHLHLELSVFEKDFSKLEVGQRVQFSLPHVTNEPLEARIFSLGKAFEGDSRMVTVHAELENNKNDKLLPGMYINGQIMAGKQELQTLPEEAIVRYKNQNYIFLKESPTSYRMARVETGVSESGFVEANPVAALPADAQIVTKGAYYILSEKMKSEVAED